MIPWRRNFMEKALALIAAIVLWASVMSEQNPIVEVDYKVPVHLVNTNSAYIVDDVPEFVRVTLRGPRNTILHLDQSTLVATINMRDVGVGEEAVPINFQPPNGLTVVNEDPSVGNLIVDEYAIREFPLTVDTAGQLPTGYNIKETKIVPEKVTIAGAKRRVDSVTRAIIAAKLDGHKDNFKVQSDIVLLNSSNQIVSSLRVTPKIGSADITVEKDIFEKSVMVVPSIKGEPAEGYRIGDTAIKPINIIISGKQDAIQKVLTVMTDPIDISGSTSTVIKNVKLQLPEGVTAERDSVEIAVPIEKMK